MIKHQKFTSVLSNLWMCSVVSFKFTEIAKRSIGCDSDHTFPVLLKGLPSPPLKIECSATNYIQSYCFRNLCIGITFTCLESTKIFYYCKNSARLKTC